MFFIIKILFDGAEQEMRNFIRVSLCQARNLYNNKSTGNKKYLTKWHQISSCTTFYCKRKDSISSRG
jgi:hypothetical protein